MTQQTKNRLIAWLVALGTIIPSVAWGWSVVDNRYVHRDEFIVRNVIDSINNVTAQRKLDEILKRQTQIECGARVVEGCR